jgi:CMP-N,N'-diacetyllegionaminic acid synthase
MKTISKNILGIILARAGSAGLTDKHLRLLCGRPVIEYTFDHAAGARRLSSTILSTDCPKLSRMATSRGLGVIHRPAELATSTASVQDAMLHAMNEFESGGGFKADGVVVIYGNVPIRPVDVIDRAIEHLIETGCDSVRSFCPVGKWHPAWMSKLEGDRVEPLVAGSIHRRQDLSPLFLHDGAVVAVSRNSMLRGRENPGDPHAFFGVDRRGIAVGVGETVEIDSARDLYMAEAILKEQMGAALPQASVA